MQGRSKSFEQLLDESLDLHVQDGVNFAEPENGGGKGAVRIFERKRTLQHPSVPPGHLPAVSAGTIFMKTGASDNFLQTKECSRGKPHKAENPQMDRYAGIWSL